MMRRSAIVLVVVVVVVAAVLPAVSAAVAGSNTPQIHFRGHSLALKVVLLTEDDVQGLPDVPGGFKVGAINKTSGLYQDPDPRLPCGQKIPATAGANTGAAVGEEMPYSDGEGFEAAASLSIAQAKALFKLNESDVHVGCSYQSTTNTGSTQSVKLVGQISMPQIVSESLGLVVTITTSGQEFGAYEMLMRNGSTVAALIIFADSPLKPDFVLALARKAETRLTGQLST
jgi:hypothetical protein